MTKTIILSLGLFLFANFSTAQTVNVPSTLVVSEGISQLDDVPRNGFNIVLTGDEKDIIKAFEDFLENSNKKYKVKSFFKKISAEDLLVPEFSEKHFNLNAEIRESGSKMELWYWVSFGTDIYVNSAAYPAESMKCKAILKEFGRKYYSDFIETDLAEIDEIMEKSNDNLKDVKDEIADLTKDQLKVKKKKEKLEKQRVKLDEKLADLNVDIKENAVEVEKKESEISQISAKIQKQNTMQSDIESKIAGQEKTAQELKNKLSTIKSL